MSRPQAQLAFCVLATAGLLVALFPGLIVVPASNIARSFSGKVDFFEVTALWTWLGIMYSLLLVTLAACFRIVRRGGSQARSSIPLLLLCALQLSATVFATIGP
jgi:hypothetical protein